MTTPAPGTAAPAPRAPGALRSAASVGARVLILVAAAAVVFYVAARLYLVTVSLAAALLVAALLWPLNQVARRAGLPRPAAAAAALLVGLAVVSGLAWFVYTQMAGGLDGVTSSLLDALDRAVRWLETGPLSLDEIDLNSLTTELTDFVGRNRTSVTSGALTIASTTGNVLAGLALSAFLAFFFVYDGERMWGWGTGLVPEHLRARVDEAGRASWATLVAYMRGTVLVALFDAVFIGAGLAILQVPLAAPLAVLVFLGAFVPLVGALLSGLVAILVASATNGLTTGLLVLALILVVQQLEGNVFQPFVLGKLVHIHPVAVILAVSAGSIVAGLPGAVFGVPLAAVINTAAVTLAGSRRSADPGTGAADPPEEDPSPTREHQGPSALRCD